MDRDTGDALDAIWPVGPHPLLGEVKVARALLDELVVDVAILDRDVQQAVCQREIGSRHVLQVQCGAAGGDRRAGTDDDEAPAIQTLVVEIGDCGRHRLRQVAADEQDRVGGGDVLEREGHSAVEPERALRGRRGGGHAKAPVVVDRGRAQPGACELAEHVGLLVGEPAAAEHAGRV
jgi:hypothetical protein